MSSNLPKIIVILGLTASGKTDVGIALAKKFNGEIISADSRQVYKEMDIATGKPTGEWQKNKFMVEGVTHHLMDIINPDQEFSLADFKNNAIKIINDILARRKLPIIVGGTGLYIWSIIDNLDIPSVAPNKKLRAELESKNLLELVNLLKQKDPKSAQTIDLKNKRRVVRALEVIMGSGQSFVEQKKPGKPLYNALQIGLLWLKTEIDARIDVRVEGQLQAGMLEETKKLLKKYSLSLNSMSGIGYRELTSYLNGEMTLPEAIIKIKNATHAYAKRQMTWFKRDERIFWMRDGEEKEVVEKVKEFLRE